MGLGSFSLDGDSGRDRRARKTLQANPQPLPAMQKAVCGIWMDKASRKKKGKGKSMGHEVKITVVKDIMMDLAERFASPQNGNVHLRWLNFI